MTMLVIGRKQRKALAGLRRLAERQIVDITEVVEKLTTPEGEEQHRDQMTAQSIHLPLAFLVTFSIEVGHPGGTMRHMSMSTSTEGRVPNTDAVWIVAMELGFTGKLADCDIWLEPLREGGKAVNVVQPIEGG